jgi:hypothetical protein
MLLCDYAEALNGKLYISGGGWHQISAFQGVTCYVALMIGIPWGATNQRHRMRLTLCTEDGENVHGPTGEDIEVSGEFEVGRPPGVRAGTNLYNTMALGFQGLPLETGRYCFVFEIDGTELARETFDVVIQELPPGVAPQ